MKNVGYEDGRQRSSEGSDVGRKQWIIIVLFILALLSISLFFLLRFTTNRIP
jgi:hypothetical protein